MSYDVYITRKTYSWDEEGPEISLAEWLAVVNADPEMEWDANPGARPDDASMLRTERERLWVWTAYSHHDEGADYAWFAYENGNIVVTNADPEIVCKMWSLAQALSAKVQGDNGEIYDSSANGSYEEPLDKKPWWRFW
jgi:hypothetical protein